MKPVITLLCLAVGFASPLGDNAPRSDQKPESVTPAEVTVATWPAACTYAHDHAAEHPGAVDYATQRAAAIADGKPLVVFADSYGCLPCAEMLREVIEPMKAAGEFEGVHFTCVNMAEQPEIAAALELTATPTFLVYYRQADGWRSRRVVGKAARGVVRAALRIPAAVVRTAAAVARPRDVSTYHARWTNHDGLSFEEHARVMHGINTAGMTRDEIARRRDADHDRYGGGHPMAMRAAGCPPGGCPPTRRGLFGGIFRR